MKLSQLIPQYHTLTHEQRVALVRTYRTRRAEDIASYVESQSKPRKSQKAAAFSDEEKMLMKVLKLTQKQFLLLRQMSPDPNAEEEEEDTDSSGDEFDLD